MKKELFFNSKNRIALEENDELDNTCSYIDSVKAFSQICFSSIYIINYERQSFEYVCDNPLFLCGHSAQEVMDMGYEFYFKHVPPEDLELLIEINEIGFDFFERQLIENRNNFTISYDFHLEYINGKRILINHKLTPLLLTKSGKLWKSICLVDMSSQKSPGNIHIINNSSGEIFYYCLKKKIWKTKDMVYLSSREKEMIQLSMKGYTVRDISDAMCVSVESVKFYRRKVFNRLGVNTISEAILKINRNDLI